VLVWVLKVTDSVLVVLVLVSSLFIVRSSFDIPAVVLASNWFYGTSVAVIKPPPQWRCPVCLFVCLFVCLSPETRTPDSGGGLLRRPFRPH